MGRLVPALILALASALVLSPANAALTLCNRTSYVLYAATGALTMPDVTVQGWTRIAPGACAEAIKGDLAAQAYYLYARSSRAHSGAARAWSGQTNLCVKDKDFSTRAPLSARCPADGYELGFASVDTHHMRSWTATFRESPDLPSMAAAERAGLKRLLSDTGVRGLNSEKAEDTALSDFRRSLHLDSKASGAALFSALETEAMKSANPVGYTVCNDTSTEFWVAIGQQKGKTFTSKGWWTVSGGSCARMITDPLAGAGIWLRVERGKGAPLAAGPDKFCVTNIEFEIQGRDRCAQRGLAEAGFALTNVKGQAGYTAHITASGLAGK